jgi:hypothetical protein
MDISKLTAALGCFALSVALLWLHGTMAASLLAARARLLASGHYDDTVLVSMLLRSDNVNMNTTLAFRGAVVFFCIGLILCIAAVFTRKAKKRE